MTHIKSSAFAAFAIVIGAPVLLSEAARNLTAVVDVIAFNDVYEMLQDEVNGLNLGGPSRVVKIAKDMRCKNPNSLVLFAGDTMSPSLWSAQFHGMQMVDAHNAIGVDFASLGNHEFDYGVEGFLNVSQASKFLCRSMETVAWMSWSRTVEASGLTCFTLLDPSQWGK